MILCDHPIRILPGYLWSFRGRRSNNTLGQSPEKGWNLGTLFLGRFVKEIRKVWAIKNYWKEGKGKERKQKITEMGSQGKRKVGEKEKNKVW